MTVVNDVNSVTIAIDGSSLGSEIHYLLFLLIVTIITYISWHYRLFYYQYGDNGNN